MEIREYGVVKNVLLLNIITEVDKLLAEGWQPLGGIAMVSGRFTPSGEASETGTPGILYAQAIVK